MCLSQGLFYRVVGGEVSPFRLVRLTSEELLSKEISEWRKPDNTEVNATSCHYIPSTSSDRHTGGIKMVCFVQKLLNRELIIVKYCMAVSSRLSLPVQEPTQGSPDWATGLTLALTAWIWKTLHQHLMQMYVFLPPLHLAWPLLQ